eukprot:s1156_g8.t1
MCVSPSADHLLRTLPPDLSLGHARVHEDAVWQCLLALLGEEDDAVSDVAAARSRCCLRISRADALPVLRARRSDAAEWCLAGRETHRIEVIANGLPLWGGVQLAVVTLHWCRAPLQLACRAETVAAPLGQLCVSLNGQSSDKLASGRRCQLVVLGIEEGFTVNNGTAHSFHQHIMTEDFGYNSLWLEVQEAAAALFGFLDVSALTAARAACQGQNVLAGVDRLFALQMRTLETEKVAKDRRRALAAARRLVPPMLRIVLQRRAEVCLQSSEHRIVRTEAVRTLQEVVDPGDHAAAQALGTVVLDEDRFVRRALVDALVVHSADPKARSALHELAQDRDPFVQNAARYNGRMAETPGT